MIACRCPPTHIYYTIFTTTYWNDPIVLDMSGYLALVTLLTSSSVAFSETLNDRASSRNRMFSVGMNLKKKCVYYHDTESL